MAAFIHNYITMGILVVWLMLHLIAATCPGGYTLVGSHCYKYHSSTPMTWTAGKSACRGIGATLPAIKSDSERNLFMGFRSESGSTWLMAQESSNTNPFEAAWLDDAPDLRPTWTDWAPSSPNGVNGECLALDTNGKFVDKSCSTSYPIYCSIRSCPSGFQKAARFCYKDLAQSTDYFTSRTQCANENARQPMFHNQENFDDFRSWNPSPSSEIWFGAEDGQEEGNWLYTDGSKHTFFDWSSNEPNDWHNEEDCSLMRTDGKFNDLNCFLESRTMCQAYTNVDTVAYCPMLFDITKGRVALSHAPAYETSLAWYFCDEGYVQDPATPFLYLANGQWNTSSVTCTLPCPALSTPENGNPAQYSKSLRPVGATATFTCAASYVLSDTTALTCLNTQNWDRSVPSCVAKCPVLSTPADGAGPTYSDANRGPSSTASFTCDANFVLSSATALTCSSGGSWSASVPTCIAQCPALSAPANGNAPTYSDSERKPTATATYSCDLGNNFYLSDTTVLTCNVGHSWDRQPPVCKRDCVWDTWGSWENCTVACGGGTQKRNRVKSVVEVNGGNCIGISSDNQTCNSHPCPIHCKWASWTGFGACSKSCGGGQKTRNRHKSVLAQHGGLDCQGLPQSIQDCNKDACNRISTTSTTPTTSTTSTTSATSTTSEESTTSTMSSNSHAESAGSISTTTKRPIKKSPLTAAEKVAVAVLQSIGCTFIISSLSITIGIFIQLRDFSVERCIQMSYEIATLCGHILVLTVRDITDRETECTLVGMAFQYFFLASFVFLLLESIQTYSILTNVISFGGFWSRKVNLLLGWLIAPMPIVIMAAAIGHSQYISDFSCWINFGNTLVIAITMVPAFVICWSTLVITEAASQGTRPPLSDGNRQQRLVAIVNHKGILFILPLSVAGWFVGAFAVYHVKVYLYSTVTFLNMLLGITVFVFHTLGNQKAHQLVLKLINKLRTKLTTKGKDNMLPMLSGEKSIVKCTNVKSNNWISDFFK